MAPGLPGTPAEFRLYDFPGYRGRRDLANFSRHAEFYGQLQRGLKKVDMASMHESLEVRVPLLDREVIDLSLRIDPFDCMRDGQRKAPLRDLLARFVPPESIPKPKRGFAVPLGDWLRGPLRPLVEETLFGGDLYPAGVFDRSAVRAYWDGHLRREKDRKWGIWTLMALQWWGGAYGRAVAAAA
jgi:asparagine synthase (glutamine-hydrolysing)